MTRAQNPILALGLLAIALCLAAAAILWPLKMAWDLRRQLALGNERLAVARRAARDGNGLSELSATRLLLGAPTEARAAAELQLAIGGAARAQNVAISSVQVLPAQRDGELAIVALEVSLEASVIALRNFVHALETSSPLIILDELSIRGRDGGEPTLNAGKRLDVAMKLRGFAAPKGAP
ncbi:MAG: type II secretion system protein GspM [Hyphomicrobium sp.]|jgi:hypothetical protein